MGKLIQVVPELMEGGGHKKVKITVKRDQEVLDADLVNPLNSTQRKRWPSAWRNAVWLRVY